MYEPAPMTQTMKATEARAQWSRLLNQVFRRERRVLVEKDGVPVAAIVSAEDLKRLQELDTQREATFQALWRTGDAFANESPEVIEREAARAVESARAKRHNAAARRECGSL